ncbi:hypothetical protein RhiJN_18380 [Ceratobasidium sp. AG-Ba]|nr:hypothetical protein RhiJN_18380 [Ceratobasidium sp. AG-Ba]
MAMKATRDNEASPDVRPGEQNINIAHTSRPSRQNDVTSPLPGTDHALPPPSEIPRGRQNVPATRFISVEPDMPSRAPMQSNSPHRGRSPSPDNQPPPREPSPGEGPWPYSRDASQEPLLDAPENTDDAPENTGDAPENTDDAASETLEAISVDDPNPYDYPYKQTPTSHRVLTTKKGKHGRGGRGETKTAIEKLGDRLSKFDYTRNRTHPFAIKKKLRYFNPYSAIRAPLACYNIVKKPKELIGGPGRGNVPLHEAAGLRMDKDFYNTLRNIVKHALAVRRPKNLAPDTNVNWSNFSAAAQRDVYRICYDLAPMFLHFRDATNEDCWLVVFIAQQYLQGKPTLTQVKETSKTKIDMFVDQSKYVDDYSANVRGNSSRSSAATASSSRTSVAGASSARASTANSGRADHSRLQIVDRSSAQDADPPRDRSDLPRARVPAGSSNARPIPNAHRISPAHDSQNDESELQSGSEAGTYDLPPTPTKRQVRKAGKQVAQEEARKENAESRPIKTPSRSTSAKP